MSVIEFIRVAVGMPKYSDPNNRSVPTSDLGLLARAKIQPIAGTTLLLTDDHHGKILDFTSGSTVTVTIPSTLQADFFCGISQGGAGQVTVVPGSGVTLNEPNSQFKTSAQYAMLSLIGFPNKSYRVYGATAA